MGKFENIAGPDGSFEAYVATPKSGKGPGVVILAEIYNVNDWMRSVVDRYAAEGFFTLAPDLFWRQKPGLYMEYNPENQQRGRALATSLDTSAAIRDIDLCMYRLRATPGCNGKVAVMGFCLGGQLAYLSGARSNPDAISVYYGTRLQHMTEEAVKIRCPAQLHFGEADTGIPVEVAYEIERLTASMPNVEVHVYADAPHAFGRDGYPPYRQDAADLAHRRTIELYEAALK